MRLCWLTSDLTVNKIVLVLEKKKIRTRYQINSFSGYSILNMSTKIVLESFMAERPNLKELSHKLTFDLSKTCPKGDQTYELFEF